jgi:hypothetical protein
MEPRQIECFDTPEAPRLGCVSDAGLGPRACEADSHAWGSGRLRAQGSKMPTTLVRLLVLVFALSYGSGLLRGLMLRRRRGARRGSVVLRAIEATHANGPAVNNLPRRNGFYQLDSGASRSRAVTSPRRSYTSSR